MKLSIMYNPVPSIINETFVNEVFYIMNFYIKFKRYIEFFLILLLKEMLNCKILIKHKLLI